MPQILWVKIMYIYVPIYKCIYTYYTNIQNPRFEMANHIYITIHITPQQRYDMMIKRRDAAQYTRNLNKFPFQLKCIFERLL